MTPIIPPGGFPSEEEEGVSVAVGRIGNEVCMQFGTPIRWIAFSPKVAERIANRLLDQASRVKANFIIPKHWDS